MDESIHIKVESPAAPAASGVSGADNGIFGIRIPRERVVPTSTWDKDNYEPSLVYPQAPIFGDYDPTTSPDYRDKSSWDYIPSDTRIDENPFADTEGEFNGGIKTALVWDGTYHRVCHALEVGGPFTFEYTARKHETRPPLEIVVKTEIGRQSDDDDFIISMSDIPPHREGQKNDPYAARPEESQDRRGAIGAPASEGKEGVIQPEMGGDNPPGLEEGDPPVPVKVEDTPLGEDHSTPVKTDSQETPMFDLSKIPHHVGDEHVVYPPAAIEPQPEPRPEPSQYPRSSKKSVNQEEMTDKNINQMDGMDICSEKLVNGSAATTTLLENAPLGLSMNVKRKFGGAKASSSDTAGGPLTNRIDDLHVQQDSNAGNGKEPAAVNNQEGAFNSAKTIQYHDLQPKTAGHPIPQPKPKPKASHASGESILARAPTSTRPPRPPRRSAAEFLELFEKETQSGKYPCTGEVPMDFDHDMIDVGPAKKYRPNRRQRKKVRETKEAARASEAAESVRVSEASESARVSEVAESVEGTNIVPVDDLAALYAHAGMGPGESSSELSSLSDSTESLAGPNESTEETKSNYNHPSQRLIIRNSDPVPDIALCRAGESVADARARLGLPPRASKKKVLPPWEW